MTNMPALSGSQSNDHVQPFRRPGAWVYSGDYRRRAEQLLEKLEKRTAEVRADAQRAVEVQKREGAWRRLPSREAIEEVSLLSDSTLMYSCLAVEEFLNYYGVVRLGEQFYTANYERLGIVPKVATVLATCTGRLIAKAAEIRQVVQRLFDRRNSLVHPKTREAKGNASFGQALSPLEGARSSVADMTRFFELMGEYDSDAKTTPYL